MLLQIALAITFFLGTVGAQTSTEPSGPSASLQDRLNAAEAELRRRFLGEHARISLNYQWENRPALNDDVVNTRFQTTLGVVF